MLELSSPVGSPEAVIAAVQSGADSIYLSVSGERETGGFSMDELASALRYCHVRDCRVYVVMDSLVSDRELGALAQRAEKFARMGVDAVQLADMGAAAVFRAVAPGLPLHAGFRAGIHNLDGALAAAALGARRVLLAPELSLAETGRIAAKCPAEVAVLAHGSLCACYGGQCYMSALETRHSGNRGDCRQLCRGHFNLGGRMDDYPLCLKDCSLIDHLRELETAGVRCVGLGGRVERPEYTALMTGIYSRAIHDGVMPTLPDLQKFTETVSPLGFTDGYLTGEKGPDMFGHRRETDRDTEKLFAEARKNYSNSERRRVPVKFYAMVRAGEVSRFAIEGADGRRAFAEGPVPERSHQYATSAADVEELLFRTGGTPYAVTSAQCAVEPGLWISAEAINDVRRELIRGMTDMKKELPEPEIGEAPPMPLALRRTEKPNMIFQVTDAAQLTPELAELSPDLLYVPLEALAGDLGAVMPFLDRGCAVAAVLPRVIRDGEEGPIMESLARARAFGVGQALINNLGHLRLPRAAGLAVRGDYGLNAYNSLALKFLEKAGLLSATASFELPMARVRELAKSVDTELIVYGRLPVMVTEHCVMKNSAGRCVCTSPGQLTNESGSVFQVLKEFGCRNLIYDSRKLYLADKREEYEQAGLWGVRLLFTTESPRECERVAAGYLGRRDYRPNNVTRALYYR